MDIRTITDLLAQTGGLQSVARDLGVDEGEVAAGASALLPEILGGVSRQVSAQPAGLDGLSGLLQQFGGGGLLDQVLSPQRTDPSAGNDVLGQIFDSPDASRAVAQNASAQTGLDPSLLKKMLPLLTMLVTGYLAQRNQAAPASAATATPAGDDALGGLLGGLLGGGRGAGSPAGGLAGMLDANGDGSAIDDLMRMAGKALR